MRMLPLFGMLIGRRCLHMHHLSTKGCQSYTQDCKIRGKGLGWQAQKGLLIGLLCVALFLLSLVWYSH